MRSLVLALIAGLLTCTPAQAKRLTNAALGLSIEKPNGWVLAPASVRRMEVESTDPQVNNALRKYTAKPLFVLVRDQKDYEGPALTVSLGTVAADRSDRQSGLRFLKTILPFLSKVADDVKVVTVPETAIVAGKASGYMALTVTAKVDGKPYSVAMESWAIPRGKYFVMLGATYPVNDHTGAQAAVMHIVNSLRLTN